MYTIFVTTKTNIMRKLEFASLQVRDLEASKTFYTTKLGFEASEMSNPDACIFKYNTGEASFAIRKPIGDLDGKALGIGASLWFAIDGTIEELQTQFNEKQVPVLGPINETPFGKTLMVKDPDGYVLTFLQAKF
jgi:lactoylglutathione lyase